MVERLGQEWTPQRAEEFRLEALALQESTNEKDVGETGSAKNLKHYLYFPTKGDADKIAEILQKREFATEVRPSASDDNFLVLVTQHTSEDTRIEEIREELEERASRFNGEYDGWEIAVESGTPKSIN